MTKYPNRAVSVALCKECRNLSKVDAQRSLTTYPPQFDLKCEVCNASRYVYLEETIIIPELIYLQAMAWHKTYAYLNDKEDFHRNNDFKSELTKKILKAVPDKYLAQEFERAKIVGLEVLYGLEDLQ